MSDSQQNPWSYNPNAPNITYSTYFLEKAYSAGLSVGWILYGIVIMVAFQCMVGLFNPIHCRGERVKWGLVSYVTVMFSLLTALPVISSAVFSISYINNRRFAGVVGLLPPGPVGYMSFISSTAISFLPDALAIMNSWLADGLLLYRCYVIYSMNLWVIAFPCVMYLGYVAVGIILINWTREVRGSSWPAVAYLSVSVSLNVLLTLMIVVRLVLHARNTRTALGITGIGGLSKAIVTMLIESCALYSASSLLVLGPMSDNENPIRGFFVPVLPATQAIASLLIIQRVANKSALTSNTIASGHLSSFRARSGGTTGTNDALPSGDPANSVDRHGAASGELEVGVQETTIE